MWDLIRDLFEPPPTVRTLVGRPRKWTHRQVVEAIIYVVVTGCQWRQLPERYPHWNTVHRYHLRWCRDGTWEGAVTVWWGWNVNASGVILNPAQL